MVSTFKYRLWDSAQTFVEVEVTGFLRHAITVSGMRAPWRAQVWVDGHWHEIQEYTLQRAIVEAAQARAVA